ncbi:MAG TPA: transcription-repair coupling factor [Thermogutta sp.]|nr:transcription-repair coupling factor [Thermogutta sp.]
MQTVESGVDGGLESLHELTRKLQTHPEFQRIIDAFHSGKGGQIDGVVGAGSALFAAAVADSTQHCVLVVLPNAQAALGFCEDLKLFTTQTATYFPRLHRLQVPLNPDDEALGDRLRILRSLISSQAPTLIVTSIEAILQAVPLVDELRSRVVSLRVGDTLNVSDLLQRLSDCGFRSVATVALPGEFSLRGGILDIFSAEWSAPLRIELFGDQIESLRRVDLETQRSVERLNEVQFVLPKRETELTATLFQYLPKDAWLILADPQAIDDTARDYFRKLDTDQGHVPIEQIWTQCGQFSSMELWDIAPDSGPTVFHLGMQTVERFSGQIERIQAELDSIGQDENVRIVCPTTAEVARLSELLRETRTAKEGRLRFVQGRLTSGFRVPWDHLVIVGAHELFERVSRDIAPRRFVSRPINDFLDLREGDLVVHVAHGIARYRGLVLLEKGEQAEEHLLLEFAEGTKLYVPASKIGLVQKYVGGTRARPKLSKLGGQAWQRQKKAVAEAVFDLAAEMLELQAIRETRPGIAFPPDSIWQQEFDASFPYEETPDQLEAMEAIKADMMRPRPMDRLLCGDVGFGKTELAMRAAFKAVDAGYQVAVLVPTTVLAEQHLRTFRERMAEFPIRIEVLSRFCTAKQEAAVLEGLANGSIDIVIGTHRLAQPDVVFQNLGLVIIDEEQRFGVEIKERLKSFRNTVDVLTMTATPIPRTLHMALVGLRDISNLATPPQDRLAVETHICVFDTQLIRQAVLRELNRGGQIYFVHNRVNDIDAVYRILCSVVPEARIRIAHAQLPDHELEEVMLSFVRHECDLLLTTTIVESGLDIPNANTIFIDHAERFGLADLHQLRGRVGRYKHHAYCYLLIHPHQLLNPNARRRLQAIAELSHLGAGFALAMKDLEIRGAGNILGTEQSGHIAAVGYELYCQLLDHAVRRLRNQPPPTHIDVNIDLPCQACLPETFVSDHRTKIDIYRKLANLSDPAQVDDFAEELRDRFGPLPPPVIRLLKLQEIRIHAHWWRIREIRQENNFVVFHFVSRKKMEALRAMVDGHLRIVDAQSAYLVADDWVRDVDRLISELKSLLQRRPTNLYNSAS